MNSTKFFLAILFALCVGNVLGKVRPVVLMHGYSVDKSSLDIPVEWIRDVFPDAYVKNVEIGDGADNSINLGIRKQVMMLCDELKKDDELKDGFNLIGFSQGTILTRGYIELCNDPPVYNYISWAGPQMGQWGAPGIPALVDEVIAPYIYTDLLQEHFAPAGYWKDPYHKEDYMEHSSLLADMNNEREEKNPAYKERLLSLNQMSLVYSPNDDFIYPPQSGWFGFFKWGSDKEIVPLQESDMYKEDWIGLRAMDERGDLFFFNTNCTHTQHVAEPCHSFFFEHTVPFLNNTLP